MATVVRDRVFLRHVMFGASGSAVREAVSQLGFHVLDVQMVRSGRSLQSNSSCNVFLTCSSEEEASRLVAALNGVFVPGLSLRPFVAELAAETRDADGEAKKAFVSRANGCASLRDGYGDEAALWDGYGDEVKLKDEHRAEADLKDEHNAEGQQTVEDAEAGFSATESILEWQGDIAG
ncbi:hypothetical protein AK812_SmicGene34139 [Symbiodinium microadriaticum]|uniref:RRM domain-containing protein n=1 Tax=Symbiodinium microadriaticum TaxID=2951 RepID=A0A1Q9CPT4_SYMMI|nr:hypothetical protein AK812_SmicGene34139 [Symbiodinium microadriaticum]